MRVLHKVEEMKLKRSLGIKKWKFRNIFFITYIFHELLEDACTASWLLSVVKLKCKAEKNCHNLHGSDLHDLHLGGRELLDIDSAFIPVVHGGHMDSCFIINSPTQV